MRAKIASHITISAKLLVGAAVLNRPTTPTTTNLRAGVPESHPCYATVMIHDLITAILMTSATVLASELLVRIWDYF